MKYDVITIGDAFEDVFVRPGKINIKKDHSFTSGSGFCFEVGEKVPLENVDYEIGGSACNAAVGFSRIGLGVSLVSVVGDDTPAEKILSRLETENVDAKNISIDKKSKTNFSVIFRLKENRTIFVYHGLDDYGKLRLKKNLKPDWIFLAPIGENIEGLERDIVAKVSERGAKFAWNPGAVQIQKGAGRFKNLLRNTSILLLNREEAIEFASYPVKPQDNLVFSKLHSFGPKLVVVTNGREGARAYDGRNYYSIPAIKNITKADPTGAGDSFTVGFLSKLIIDKWQDDSNVDLVSGALKWGISNSSSVIQEIGAQKGLLNQDQIEKNVIENDKRIRVEIKQ